MRRAKITVIGAGSVGATTAMRLAEGGAGDVLLLDLLDGLPQGKALDLRQATPLLGHGCCVTGTNEYGDAAGSDVIVMTAGLARKPGMSRDDLLDANSRIVAECMTRVRAGSPAAVIIMVTNPVDVMCEVARRVTGFPRTQLVGMGGILDAARMRVLIAAALDVSVDSVSAVVLGGHGDSMVLLPRHTTVSGAPVADLLTKERVDDIVRRTAAGGSEIVELLKTGSAYYAPAAAVFVMVDSIVHDRKKILPCSVFLQGEFGLSDVFLGVPCKLGAQGMEGVFELALTAGEMALLERSAADVKAQTSKLPQDLAPT